MVSISSFSCIFTYAIAYVLLHYIIFRLYLYFLNNVLYFSSTPVLTFSIDVVFILSIWKYLNSVDMFAKWDPIEISLSDQHQ